MPFKDPEKNRAYQREWTRRKKRWLLESVKAYKVEWNGSRPRVAAPTPRPKHPAAASNTRVVYDPATNQMVIVPAQIQRTM